jgi:hypothetical protein
MKTTGRWIFAAFLGLSLLSLNVPAVAEDDWAHQHAQAQREREEWQRQQEQAQREQAQRERDQAQRDREQADRDRQARDDWYKQQEQAQKERDDWYRQQAQTQKERDEWYAQQAQAQRDREQADRDRQARDDWYKQQAQAQKERDDWYAQQAQTQRDREQAEQDQKERDDWYKQQQQVQRDYQQSILNGIERVKQQRDEILNKVYDEHPWAGAGWTAAGSVAALPRVQPAGVPQIRYESDAIPPQPLLILNPFTFPMARPNQEPVRQQTMQPRPNFDAQIIQNPFVVSKQ